MKYSHDALKSVLTQLDVHEKNTKQYNAYIADISHKVSEIESVFFRGAYRYIQEYFEEKFKEELEENCETDCWTVEYDYNSFQLPKFYPDSWCSKKPCVYYSMGFVDKSVHGLTQFFEKSSGLCIKLVFEPSLLGKAPDAVWTFLITELVKLGKFGFSCEPLLQEVGFYIPFTLDKEVFIDEFPYLLTSLENFQAVFNEFMLFHAILKNSVSDFIIDK